MSHRTVGALKGSFEIGGQTVPSNLPILYCIADLTPVVHAGTRFLVAQDLPLPAIPNENYLASRELNQRVGVVGSGKSKYHQQHEL